MGKNKILKCVFFAMLLSIISGCQNGSLESKNNNGDEAISSDPPYSDPSYTEPETPDETHNTQRGSCTYANVTQLTQVNLGLTKLDQFLNRCYAETGSKLWCDQIARPNPDSRPTFNCTYSPQQPHFLIHPDEQTWAYAIQAVKLVQEMVSLGIGVEIIYNWWRPEPYNANVGGAAGRHPYGTSVDVRFRNKAEQNRAHKQLCEWRSHGRLRALGYYAGTGLHLGVGDTAANTWGKGCSAGYNSQ